MRSLPITTYLSANQLMAVALCVLGGGLLIWHIAVWRERKADEADPSELNFYWRQFRRRMQASSLMVVLGCAILASELIQSQLVGVIYWAAVLLLVFWMGVLALADIIATQYHFGREKQRIQLSRARLEAEFNDRAAKPKSVQAAETARKES